jgi:hypothetical protein
MNVTDILAQTGGLQQMARELGISEADASRGAQALAPTILGGFKKQAQTQPGGLAGLGGLLGQLGGGGLLADVLSPQPTDISRGDQVLGQIFGSKDVSRTVAQHASAQSGLAPEILKRMLPMLAMAIAGYMAGGRGGTATPGGSAGGGLGGLLGGLLGGGAAGASGNTALGSLASMLDMDGNGNPLDDLLRKAGGNSR